MTPDDKTMQNNEELLKTNNIKLDSVPSKTLKKHRKIGLNVHTKEHRFYAHFKTKKGMKGFRRIEKFRKISEY